MTPREALLKAIQTLGSQTATAAAAGPDVETGHVYYWLNKASEVPAKHCPPIERATRLIAAEQNDPSLIVTCEELCPSVDWAVLRMQAA